MSSVIIVLFYLLSLSFGRKNLINGCKSEDIVTLQNIVNNNYDLLNINQNANTVSDELIDFYEENFAEDYTYRAVADFTSDSLSYSSRDEFLYGSDESGLNGYVSDIVSTGIGKLGLFTNTCYAKCLKEGFKTTATFTCRGGDAIRGNVQQDGSQYNTFTIARFVLKAQKTGGGKWKLKSGDVDVNLYQQFQFQ